MYTSTDFLPARNDYLLTLNTSQKNFHLPLQMLIYRMHFELFIAETIEGNSVALKFLK